MHGLMGVSIRRWLYFALSLFVLLPVSNHLLLKIFLAVAGRETAVSASCDCLKFVCWIEAPDGCFSRKEVFQPHLPVRLPCYDLAPVTGFTLGRSLRSRPSGTPGSHGLTGGVYKARERIHRAMADARLLANPASRSRVADSDPN